MGEMKHSKLLPCPFCGSEDLDIELGLFIECNDCGASGPGNHVGDADIDPERNAFDETVEMWNKASMAVMVAQITVDAHSVHYDQALTKPTFEAMKGVVWTKSRNGGWPDSIIGFEDTNGNLVSPNAVNPVSGEMVITDNKTGRRIK